MVITKALIHCVISNVLCNVMYCLIYCICYCNAFFFFAHSLNCCLLKLSLACRKDSLLTSQINPFFFFSVHPFFTPSKHQKTSIFDIFEGLEKGCIEIKWFNFRSTSISIAPQVLSVLRRVLFNFFTVI